MLCWSISHIRSFNPWVFHCYFYRISIKIATKPSAHKKRNKNAWMSSTMQSISRSVCLVNAIFYISFIWIRTQLRCTHCSWLIRFSFCSSLFTLPLLLTVPFSSPLLLSFMLSLSVSLSLQFIWWRNPVCPGEFHIIQIPVPASP